MVMQPHTAHLDKQGIQAQEVHAHEPSGMHTCTDTEVLDSGVMQLGQNLYDQACTGDEVLTPRVRQLRPRLQPPPPAEAGMKGLLAPSGRGAPVLRTQRLPSCPSRACPLDRAWVRAGYC